MGRKRIKQYLLLLLAIGVIAIVASGSGTFASFNAETTNPNNTFATGTLFLHNTSGSTTCTSESASDNLSTSSSCATLFSVPNLGPGDVKTATLTLTNAGSVDSPSIKFDTPSTGCVASAATIGTLNTQVGTSATTSVLIDNLTQTLVSNTVITLTDGSFTQNFTVATTTAPASSGPTTVPVVSATPTHTFPANTTTISLNASFGTPTNLCNALTISIQEMNGSTPVACAYGTGTTSCTAGTAISAIGTTPVPLNLDTSSFSGLPASKSRTFQITVTAPSTLSNADQNRQAKFDLLWHIEH
jgi:predicted ribosomally synthesized peptide with SipW-like signal peptide